MISEVKAYILECDNCKVLYEDNCDSFSIWNDESVAIESAIDEDWIEYEGKHYCPDCYTEGENGDDDEIQIIKEREGKYDQTK